MKLIILISVLLNVFASQAQNYVSVQGEGRIAELTPYQCILRRDQPAIYIYGAATIITPRHVMTAANLVVGYGLFLVGVGSNHFDQLIYYNTREVSFHPEFSKAALGFNFAIFHLEHSLTINSFVQPIALPPLNSFGPQLNEQGSFTKFARGTILKKSYQRVLNDTMCPISDWMVNGSLFCAGYEESESCMQGEFGNAFVVQYFGVDTFMGIASGNTDCESNIQYARITSAREWIHELTGI